MDGLDYGDETNNNYDGVDDSNDVHIPLPFRQGYAEVAVEQDDSDVDEDEIRDNIDEDPPLITVQYEIKILCAKEILMRDGTQLKVICHRGE